MKKEINLNQEAIENGTISVGELSDNHILGFEDKEGQRGIIIKHANYSYSKYYFKNSIQEALYESGNMLVENLLRCGGSVTLFKTKESLAYYIQGGGKFSILGNKEVVLKKEELIPIWKLDDEDFIGVQFAVTGNKGFVQKIAKDKYIISTIDNNEYVCKTINNSIREVLLNPMSKKIAFVFDKKEELVDFLTSED